MSRTLPASAFVALVALTGAAASASIVVNGDFEMPQITSAFQVASSGSTLITGWTVSAPSADQGVDLVSTVAGQLYANTGRQAIDLAGTPGRGSISQDLATDAGSLYELSFFLSSNGGTMVSGVTVLWDGVEVATLDSPEYGTWTQFTYQVGAIDAASTLTFRGNVDGFGGSLVDTVSVTLIPAPSAAVMATVLMLGAARRRRAS